MAYAAEFPDKFEIISILEFILCVSQRALVSGLLQYLRQHVGLMGQNTSLATSEHREAAQRPLSSTLRGPNKA